MYSVKEIIREAAIRVNLGRRNQGLNDGLEETGFRLLKGVITKYNNDDLMSFTQNSMIVKNNQIIHIYDETDSLHGEFNMYFDNIDELNAYILTEEDYMNNVWAIVKGQNGYWIPLPHSETYLWSYRTDVENNQRYQEMREYEAMEHVKIRNVSKINTIYLVNKGDHQLAIELKFVPKQKMDDFVRTSPIYTTVQKSETEWLIYLKPYVSTLTYDVKINYNEGIDVDINDDLYIPDAYTELLIVSLAYKLALQFPRLDANQMDRLQQDMRTMIENVRTPKADVKGVLRDTGYGINKLNQDQLMSGIYLF